MNTILPLSLYRSLWTGWESNPGPFAEPMLSERSTN